MGWLVRVNLYLIPLRIVYKRYSDIKASRYLPAGGDINKNRHLIVSILLLKAILIVGTAGYMIIEDWRFLDALYMTIITISTVGYREINQIGDPGRVFTILLVAGGVGFTLYVAAAVAQFMVEGRMRILLGRRRLDQKINRLKNLLFVLQSPTFLILPLLTGAKIYKWRRFPSVSHRDWSTYRSKIPVSDKITIW